MRRRTLLTLLVPLLAGVAACATTPPAPVTTAASSPAVESATPTRSPIPTPTPPPTPTPTATITPSPAAILQLRGDGLGDHGFGTRQAEVTATLKDVLGAPDERFQGVICELDGDSPWAETFLWGDFWVEYDAPDSSKKSPRTLAAWGVGVDAGLPARLVVQDDVPLDATFAQLKARYPRGRTNDLGLGDGSKRFLLPNGIFFVGAGSRPDRMQAGAFSLCE